MKKFCSHGMFYRSLIFLLVSANLGLVLAQRLGGISTEAIENRLLITNGPVGPIHGGESAVTDMILLSDGLVYGSTRATWGASKAHLFKTDGKISTHLVDVSSFLSGQTAITDLEKGATKLLYGATSTYDQIFDEKQNSYGGGHLFSFDPLTGKLKDLIIVAKGQGINCIKVDTLRGKIYGVTYPAGHLFAYDLQKGTLKDFGEIMTPWRVKDLGRVTWRGVPKVLMLDEAGSIYFSTYFRSEVSVIKQEQMKGTPTSYSSLDGGRIYKLSYGSDKPIFTGAVIPVQKGMDSDPLYENGIASAIAAGDGSFWCGTINDGFLFRFDPATASVINKGKAFQYWNLKSLAFGADGKLYMLGGRDEDNSWLMSYDPVHGALDCYGWPENTAQCSVICADRTGKILMAENLRYSFIWTILPEKLGMRVE